MEGVVLSKLSFDTNGNPKPYGVIDLNLNEFEDFYVKQFKNSKKRKYLFDCYINYTINLCQLINCSLSQLIGGSYTTNKINPNDIDLVNIVKYSNKLNSITDKFPNYLSDYGSKDIYNVDGYMIIEYDETDIRYSFTKEYMDYWTEFFGHDKYKNPKALIKIIVSE